MNVFAVPDLPEIRAGDDLGALIDERVDVRADDIICVASTVVSKANGRTVDLADVTAGSRAIEIAERLESLTGEEKDPRFAQVVLDESTDLLLSAPFLLTETPFGHITVNAGIDRSNVPDADLVLLPSEPSTTAEALSAALGAPVIVTDTCGRPFRHGQRGVAIGWAGLPASRDWRGEYDRDGHELEVTVEAVVDELAAAANLLSGEGDGGTPAVVIRDFEFGDHGGSDELFRTYDGDLVRQALEEWEYRG
ncbi:coenzyme F420-0:L-glutamate ligase [Halocatena pleomorpha]|uniref:Coenzyme F420-0:L-glutamate ligase n=1 Tax=Halocatena pleomorpha TaxID=1785090 RepID=A0A3P3R571_9EURY|nr:coenzyme F420-0:L-glutamate ligase [Halocatena pleomorpha]RRJ28637.1 coenzyme F420-0:L-glutamate ligase [Halocatena pleomorpha]